VCNSSLRICITKFETNVINEQSYKKWFGSGQIPNAMSLQYGGKDRLKYPLLTEVNYGEIAVRLHRPTLQKDGMA
jgi:hypothetical protein